MIDNETIKALDILDKLDFFGGQRAGRELWNDKPVDVQNKDIENFKKDISFLKDFINHQKAEIERLICRPPKDPMDFCGVVCKYAEELIQEAKAETVKEFAKMLRANKIKGEFAQRDDYYVNVINIDQLEEMASDVSGEQHIENVSITPFGQD